MYICMKKKEREENMLPKDGGSGGGQIGASVADVEFQGTHL